jgi:cupin 2 domain-containing protein
LPEELTQTLLSTPGLRIERIVSLGHQSPETFWYDQEARRMGPAPEGGSPAEIRGGGADRVAAGDVRQHPGPLAAPGRVDRPA